MRYWENLLWQTISILTMIVINESAPTGYIMLWNGIFGKFSLFPVFLGWWWTSRIIFKVQYSVYGWLSSLVIQCDWGTFVRVWVCVCVSLSVHGLQSKREKFSSVENCIYNISSLFRAKETTEETEKLVQTLSANGKYRKWKTLSSTNYIYVYNTNIQTQRKIEV